MEIFQPEMYFFEFPGAGKVLCVRGGKKREKSFFGSVCLSECVFSTT